VEQNARTAVTASSESKAGSRWLRFICPPKDLLRFMGLMVYSQNNDHG
jgi:hypothetical protein